RPVIAGNWKMHKTVAEARELSLRILDGARDVFPRIGLFPPALSLPAVVEEVRRVAGNLSDEVLLGAQNLYPADEGAFTGEISAPMIRAAGGNAVIVGHSERRQIFGETSDFVGLKVEAAIHGGLVPIFCVGETLDEREDGRTTAVVGDQLARGLTRIERPDDLARVIIAYEPVWAIGTGRTASPDQAQEVHAYIREELGKRFAALGGDPPRRDEVLILYGGSVKPANAADLLSQPDVDGALVGGASLDADSFLGICRACPAEG